MRSITKPEYQNVCSFVKDYLGLAGQPVHEFAHPPCRPFEAVAVDDQESADDEDCEADLRHDTSIQWFRP